MSPTGRYLSLLLLFSLLPSSQSVKCDACEGEECKKGGCKGDYCISSYYSPRFGSFSLLKKPVLVKGCLNGTMMAENVKSRCYSNGLKYSETCICDTDECTSTNDLPEETTKKITCACTLDKGCNGGECKGDLCYWTKHLDGKKETKGCMDLSVPLLERRAIDSCMLPPMSGSMHFLALGKGVFDKEVLNTESCICSTDNCNENKPIDIDAKKLQLIDSQKCSAYVKMTTTTGRIYETKKDSCDGEFCYKMAINAKGTIPGQMRMYVAEGCATFAPDRKMDEEFGSGKCVDYKGNNLNMKTCFKTDDTEAMKRLEEAVQKEEEESDEGENEEGEEDEEIVLVEKISKGKHGKSKGKKEEEEEEEKEEEKEKKEIEERKDEKEKEEEKKEEDQKNIGEKENNPTPTKHFVWIEPTEASIPDESNATMITVFVLIILCICVAGITWKFQLHRKLMRANYDTVAGG